ncbi:hypothetical protein [Pseudomonas gelidaquae]|uniref:hypothetical protein n=1 Tax=Pseudomonas sp. IB20 TaxID=1702250 RepID=UPI0012D2A411|nr:hypothetical protein [Pseudomonas sp. IB20]
METLGRINVVLGADHDRVTAERDALQLLLNQRDEQVESLEQQREAELRNGQDMQQRLTAADELVCERTASLLECGTRRKALERRVDVLEGLLREVVAPDPYGEFLGWQLDAKIDAALKTAEGGGADTKKPIYLIGSSV